LSLNFACLLLPSHKSQWTAADALDQPGVCPGNCDHPELYTLDASPYESLHVTYHTILRGKGVPLKEQGNPKPVQHPEYDSIYLGFSRNGFDISRPPGDQPADAPGFQLRAGRRRPFASMSPRQQSGVTTANDSWNFGGVQSTTGSPVLAPDNKTLLFYFGGQQGFSHSCVGPGSQTGVAQLRRDGFAAMETGDSAGVVTTAPVSGAKAELFVNFAGTLSVDVLDAATLQSLLGPSELLSGDSTFAQVVWPKQEGPLEPFVGKALRLRFTLGAATRLFAFWTAADACGASYGFVGAGGPGAPDGVDSNGRC
jgi:hypothetical protein